MTSSHKEMNVGVELLLKRMETHPEEFTEQGKWTRIIQEIHKYAEPEESKALNDALKALMMQRVTELVLEGLVDPKPSTSLKDLLHSKLQNATLSAGLTQGQVWANNQLAQAQAQAQAQIDHMKAHADWLKREEQLKKQKEHKTVFGRLHEYFGNL